MSEMSMSDLAKIADEQGEIPETKPKFKLDDEELRQRFIKAAQTQWTHGQAKQLPDYSVVQELSQLIEWIHGKAEPPATLYHWAALLDESELPGRIRPKTDTAGWAPLAGYHRDEVKFLRTRLAHDGEPPEVKERRLADEAAEAERQRQLRKLERQLAENQLRRKLEFVPDEEHHGHLAQLLEGSGNQSFREFCLAKLTDEEFLDDNLDDEERKLLYRVCHSTMATIRHKEQPYVEDGYTIDPDPSLLEEFHDSILLKVRAEHSTTGGIGRFLSSSGEAVEPDWIIDGLVARKDRWVITGSPGSGKSHLGMQICWDATRGVHPLTGEPLQKRARTMFVNLELNDDDISAMLVKLGATDDPEIEIKIGDYQAGMEITDDGDKMVEFLRREVEAWQPDIIWLAGIYKMTSEDMGHKVEPVRRIHALVDGWRNELASKPAVMLEAQKGHSEHRPKGGSEWMFWPEFGIHLGKDGAISEWRQTRNDQRFVPEKLERADGRWMLPRDVGKLCFDLIAAEGHMSNQVLGERLGVSKHTVGRNFTSEDKDAAVEVFESNQ